MILSKVELEQLLNIAKCGVVWVGNLISKIAAYRLVELGLVVMDENGNYSLART